VARTCSLIFMVLDVLKPLGHKKILENELEGYGIRLNVRPPQITFRKKEKGGLSISSTVRPHLPDQQQHRRAHTQTQRETDTHTRTRTERRTDTPQQSHGTPTPDSIETRARAVPVTSSLTVWAVAVVGGADQD
jgi:hypothetical protein